MSRQKSSISKKIYIWLFSCVLTAFAIATVVSFIMNTDISRENTHKLLVTNIDDVCGDVHETDSVTILNTTLRWADYFDDFGSFEMNQDFKRMINNIATGNDIDEINIIDENGIIVASNSPEFLGYEMKSADQSREFMVLIDNPEVKTFVQGLREQGYNNEKYRYAGSVFKNHAGFIQLGISEAHYNSMITDLLKGSTRYRRIGDNGAIYIFDRDFNIISLPKGHEMPETGKGFISKEELLTHHPVTLFEYDIKGTPCYCMYQIEQECVVLAVQPVSEATLTRNNSVILSSINVFFIFIILFIVIWLLIRKLVVKNIDLVNESLARITKGDLEEVVNVRDSYEFDSLSTDINKTVDRLKTYIHEAETRMDADLALAKAIQKSALPSEFPAFPNNKEFDVYAGMMTAKEVGGDFYDFYFSGDDMFTITIADVAGKGIPAAMFMMRGKSVLNNIISTGVPLDEACARVNDNLCQNNETTTFFTGWIGTVNLNTGEMTYVNAGHNKPLIRRNGGIFEFLDCKPGLAMAVFDGFQYTMESVQLKPGDEIFLYTDGVTEATNLHEELFGDERLQASLNSIPLSMAGKSQDICNYVLSKVHEFTNGAEQSDDITMLCFRYLGA